MSLGDHLREFRRRLVISALGLVVGMILGWLLTPYVWDLLREPILRVAASQGRQVTLNYVDVTSAFDVKLKISFFLSVVITSPLWIYEIWAFVTPAMTRRERLRTVGFLGAAVPLFLAGCFAGWLVLPNMVSLMTGFVPQEDASVITAPYYFDFVLRLMLLVGLAFVVPVFLVVLNLVGVMSAATILHGWRVAILLITIFTALATPAADIVSMLLLATPMVALYFGAAAIAWLHDRRALRRDGKSVRQASADSTV